MDFEERPLLHFADLALALLRASTRKPASLDDAARLLAHDLTQAHEAEPPDPAELARHLDRACRHLAGAQLVEMLDSHRLRITPRGRAVLHAHPDGIDDTVLMEFAEFRHFLDETTPHLAAEEPRARDFQRGWAARFEGRELGENPFSPDSAQHAAWEDGWLEADRS